MTPRPRNPRPRKCPPLTQSAPVLSEQPMGFECRNCGCRHFYVVYTRLAERGVTRVRACRHCGHRIVTREALLGDPVRGQYRS